MKTSTLIIMYLSLIIFGGAIFPKHNDALYYFQVGEKYYSDRQWSDAISNYTKAIKIDDKYMECYFKRGMARVKMDSVSIAIEDFNKTISLETIPNGEPYLQRANARFMLHDSAGACADWSDACEFMNNKACELQRKNCDLK